MNPADFSYGAPGISKMHGAGAGIALFGFAEGGLDAGDRPAGGLGTTAGRVAFGQFAVSDAVVGLVFLTAVVLYLGTRVLK